MTRKFTQQQRLRLLLMKHFRILSQSKGPHAMQVAATRAVAQLMQIIIKDLKNAVKNQLYYPLPQFQKKSQE